MEIVVDSVEYKCWHEAGHAAVCLHFGGEVELIELLVGHERGHARTRCDVPPEFERSVACGGFAAEFILLDRRHAKQAQDDERNISQVVFHNATADREAFWDRDLGPDEFFSEAEDLEFMNHAINVVVPILNEYFDRMQSMVDALYERRRLDGPAIRAHLRPGGSDTSI